jgi:hypothetical protein
MDACCITLCNYRTVGFIPKKTQTSGFDLCKGLTYSFALSVGNKTSWVDVIESSCSKCVEKAEKSEEFDSCGIPLYLFEIIDCAYIEQFLNCVDLNPYRIEQCDLTREYVRDCLQ